MTIGYSTTWPKTMPAHMAGKPTHFVEKIWAGLLPEFEDISISDYESFNNSHIEKFGSEMTEYDEMFVNAKYHTLREDPSNRWKVGMKIHPVINNRTKNRFQFAPVLEVKGIQEIKITHSRSNPGIARIRIDGKIFYEGPTRSSYKRHLEYFIRNDGFDSVEDFFAWFNKDFSGKIISWVDIKY